MTIIEFKPRKKNGSEMAMERLWTCNCGGNNFRLLQGGEIRCWDCHSTADIRHFDPQESPDATR